MRDCPANAQLALLLEVTGTPKPGNVDRHRDYDTLRFEHFMAGAVGARPGFEAAAAGTPIGTAFAQSIEGMSHQSGGNTQFGALLAIMPLVQTAATTDLTPNAATMVVEETTIEDACAFYRAFDHVDVAVPPPPPGLEDLDVRRGSDATSAITNRGISLYQVMDHAASHDGIAAEWTTGFQRSFEAAEWLLTDDGPIYQRTSRTFLRLLADQPDTFIITRNGQQPAEEVTERAAAVLEGTEAGEVLADELVARDINPGTTADITAAALFIALERGLEV